MSLEDPFFVVKDEVFKALNKTRGLYLRWRELGNNIGAEAEWTTTELRNSLRSIEWDLEDLEDTIAIVEKNPNRFKIDNKELSSRRNFIDATRDEVKLMKDKMSNNRIRNKGITVREPLLDNINSSTSTSLTNSVLNTAASMATRHSGTKYSKLENSLDSPAHYVRLDSPSHKFISDNGTTQQIMMVNQNEQLDVISDSIGTLKTVSRQIGMELDEQSIMLDDFGNELETTESKLDTTIKKMVKMLHLTNDKRQWMAICLLSAMLVLVALLFFIL